MHDEYKDPSEDPSLIKQPDIAFDFPRPDNSLTSVDKERLHQLYDELQTAVKFENQDKMAEIFDELSQAVEYNATEVTQEYDFPEFYDLITRVIILFNGHPGYFLLFRFLGFQIKGLKELLPAYENTINNAISLCLTVEDENTFRWCCWFISIFILVTHDTDYPYDIESMINVCAASRKYKKQRIMGLELLRCMIAYCDISSIHEMVICEISRFIPQPNQKEKFNADYYRSLLSSCYMLLDVHSEWEVKFRKYSIFENISISLRNFPREGIPSSILSIYLNFVKLSMSYADNNVRLHYYESIPLNAFNGLFVSNPPPDIEQIIFDILDIQKTAIALLRMNTKANMQICELNKSIVQNVLGMECTYYLRKGIAHYLCVFIETFPDIYEPGVYLNWLIDNSGFLDETDDATAPTIYYLRILSVALDIAHVNYEEDFHLFVETLVEEEIVEQLKDLEIEGSDEIAAIVSRILTVLQSELPELEED